ncbi:MAG TPA: helix-turn-helix domain-containing protein [Bryobacteraceae bacterium]|jgi:putative transposase|nr:helix-turn-helix domain-containing protein [Bryobacteraceae bacterium]
MRNSRWLRLLAYVTGSVNQELLLRNEYLAAENRVLRTKLPARLRLSNQERITLSEIAKRLGRKALAEVACVAKPDTILGWYRRLVAQKFDGSKHRQYPGRPSIPAKVEELVVRMARENSGWGYDRIVGALANVGHKLSDQTVKNILRRHGITPAPKRSQVTTWKDFLAAHMNVLAGCDFFTVEVLSWRGLVTYYVLFFLHLESRRVYIAGITKHPDQEWMEQIARSATQQDWGYLHSCRYVLHDRDTKFCAPFRSTLAEGGVKTIQLPAQSPNLNAFAERWVRSVKQECLSKLILVGEASLSRVLVEYDRHYHYERNHQGKDNQLLFPSSTRKLHPPDRPVVFRQRLGGLLKYYQRRAA